MHADGGYGRRAMRQQIFDRLDARLRLRLRTGGDAVGRILAFESQRMAIPDCRFLGLRSKDFERCQLSDSVKIALNDNDRKRAKQIAGYPWFAKKRDWQREKGRLLRAKG